MIVPQEISPIDYLKDSNEFIFTLEDFILRINYQEKVFELVTPDNIAYNENFNFIKSPPEYFEVIDFGLVEWIRKAINWSRIKPKPVDKYKTHKVEIEGKTYTIRYNPSNDSAIIYMPGRSILTNYNCFLLDFPEIQFIDHGELISVISTHVFSEVQGLEIQFSKLRKFYTPIELNPKTIETSQNSYEYDYLIDYDLIFLKIPNRQIHTNMLTITKDVPELAEMHQGMMIDVIRDVVYNSPN